MPDFEKLGAFYLGRPCDLATRTTAEAPLLYDSRDLVTHAACIGMTGSGKTGLCVGLIEEALIDGIPALIIDPKGDLSNLLLTFPDLSAGDFLPWVNDDDARRAGETVEAYAVKEADKWRAGLGRWGRTARGFAPCAMQRRWRSTRRGAPQACPSTYWRRSMPRRPTSWTTLNCSASG